MWLEFLYIIIHVRQNVQEMCIRKCMQRIKCILNVVCGITAVVVWNKIYEYSVSNAWKSSLHETLTKGDLTAFNHSEENTTCSFEQVWKLSSSPVEVHRFMVTETNVLRQKAGLDRDEVTRWLRKSLKRKFIILTLHEILFSQLRLA